MRGRRIPLACALAFSVVIAGCASAVKNAQSTALNGVDLVRMTDDMAGKIGSDSAVNTAAANGPLKIVVLPVVNELQAEVIPAGQANAFTGRLRVLLARHAPDRFVWCMNRDAFYDLQRRELDLGIDPGPSPDRVQPDYALTATFSSLTDENRKRRDTFYVCAFQLTNLKSSAVLWASSYELKKEAVKGFLD